MSDVNIGAAVRKILGSSMDPQIRRKIGVNCIPSQDECAEAVPLIADLAVTLARWGYVAPAAG